LQNIGGILGIGFNGQNQTGDFWLNTNFDYNTIAV